MFQICQNESRGFTVMALTRAVRGLSLEGEAKENPLLSLEVLHRDVRMPRSARKRESG
jgi:hypothetical protein